MRILAVDPGGTTGWASWIDGVVSWGQTPGGIEGVARGDNGLVYWGPPHTAVRIPVGGYHTPDVLIIERYTIGERTVKFSRQSDALEITGLLKAVSLENGVLPVLQQPRDAKRLFTDDRLRQMGWWAKGEEHARDALRHLGFYCARKRLIRLTSTDGG